MNKKIVILLFVPLLLLTGCVKPIEQKQTEKVDLDTATSSTDLWQEEEEKIKLICDQDMIPVYYAEQCYFRELEFCENTDLYGPGKSIPKSELEKCSPVFLRNAIQSMEDNLRDAIRDMSN